MSEPSQGDHALSPLFDPRSIAVVGASADPRKRGHQILRALGESGYRGRVFPVNPKGESILGHRAYASIASLPEATDLAILCTPAAAAPELVEACGKKGIAGAVVLAVGFGESGPAGREIEQRLVRVARDGNVRIVGPNTSGILNLHSGVNLIGAAGVRPGGLALLVQSGNMALALMNEATGRTWEGVSICVGVGNQCDIGFSEVLDYLETDDQTRGVIVYAEGLKNARTFLHVAARVTRSKPVVMIKSGRSERGAAAALSHTGAVAGSHDRLSAGLEQAGVTELLRTDELIHVAETLANQPPVRPGTGIAILSDGGGQGTLAVDTLSDLEAPLAELSTSGQERLRELLGPAAAVSNPVDLAGAADGDPMVFSRALEVLSDEPTVGAILIVGLFGGYAIRFAEQLLDAEVTAARTMAERMARSDKALVVHSMYAPHRSPPLEALGRGHVPVVESLDVACRCIRALCDRGSSLSRTSWEPGDASVSGHAPDVITAALEEGRSALTEAEARSLLGGYGVPFGQSVVVRSASEAAGAFAQLVGPVALKVLSGHIVHKTEAGGVHLGASTADEAARAFEELARATSAYASAQGLPTEAAIALVTPMCASPLAEILIGAYRDPGLGPVLTIGSGGTWVEVLEDVQHRVLPVTPDEMSRMLDRLRIKRVLDGARGRPGADIEAILASGSAVAECIVRCPDIREVEINPLFVYSDRVEPIDARILI